MADLFGRIRNPSNPRFIAHRGCLSIAPENSLPAFEEAAARGFWAIETDVRITKDGILVCCHDDTLLRMFGLPDFIRDMTSTEIRRLKFTGGNEIGRYPETSLIMPFFSEYLAICRHYGNIPFIEIKDDVTGLVIQQIRKFDPEDSAVISSSNFDHLAETRKISQKLFIHHIFSEEGYIDKLSRLGYGGMAFNYPDLGAVPPGLVEKVHDAGVRICFRAGDTRETVLRMLEMGLDYIPTNVIW
jgi:glycerophosphoryl diester phosphodiesterase